MLTGQNECEGVWRAGTFTKPFPQPRPDQQIECQSSDVGGGLMMSKRRVLLGSAAMAAMALAGCSSSESTGPSSGNTLDLSALISEMAYGTGSVAAASAVGGLPVAATPPVVPSSCQYSAATQGFNCATLNVLFARRRRPFPIAG
jgi:outer membrane murein-binding lipoprotein Lpp